MENNNFFSMDRLIEFGMGMSVAQQMTDFMNKTMNNMYVPGSIQSMPPPVPQPSVQKDMTENSALKKELNHYFYYIVIAGKIVGPLDDKELTTYIVQKQVNKDTLAWVPGMDEWKPIEQIPEIVKLIALTPPPIEK